MNWSCKHLHIKVDVINKGHHQYLCNATRRYKTWKKESTHRELYKLGGEFCRIICPSVWLLNICPKLWRQSMNKIIQTNHKPFFFFSNVLGFTLTFHWPDFDSRVHTTTSKTENISGMKILQFPREDCDPLSCLYILSETNWIR